MLSMTRREALLNGATLPFALAADSSKSRLSVEAYIFQQYAQRQQKKLVDVLPEVIPMAKSAGFENIELNGEFFAPALLEQTLQLVRANWLSMPSVYSGGGMHEPALADETIKQALKVAAFCKPFGCTAVVCNANPKGPGVEKTDAELAFQAQAFDRMGRELANNGFELRVHNHTPEMLSGAREWRSTLQKTDPKLVSLCLDLDWVHQGDQDPLGLLKEAGGRVHEIHVRNSRNKLWLEAFEPGDVDYRATAEYLSASHFVPLIVVELAYRDATTITRPLLQDLSMSRRYAQKIFGVRA